MYRELNEGKAVLAGHRREVEEINNKKNAEITSLNTRLQQVQNLIAGMQKPRNTGL